MGFDVLAPPPLAANAEPGPAPAAPPTPFVFDHGLLARCQADVGAFFNFELLDEDRLAGWQSGLLWRDVTPKPSYHAFKEAVAQVRSDSVDCARVPDVSGAPVPPAKPRVGAPEIG